jgi:hypothetical protein
MKTFSKFFPGLNRSHQVLLLSAVVLSILAGAAIALAASDAPQLMYVQSG